MTEACRQPQGRIVFGDHDAMGTRSAIVIRCFLFGEAGACDALPRTVRRSTEPFARPTVRKKLLWAMGGETANIHLGTTGLPIRDLPDDRQAGSSGPLATWPIRQS
jgi:hypothetical protein